MSDVIDANIAVHTALADHYSTDEPHFRPENKAKVSGRLKDLADKTGGGALLDLGCGTGFIIDLARPYFDAINGIDITPAMLKQVDTSDPKVNVQIGMVEDLPFADNSFDAASAYSFFDHLEDPRKMLAEALRVLKPSGLLYIDLVPNEFYWQALANEPFYGKTDSAPFVDREFRMVTENDKRVEQQYGIDAETFRKAEPSKLTGGVDPFAVQAMALDIGFEACDVHFDWFLGNGPVLHGDGADTAAIVHDYLTRALPVSKHLFKYVWFVLKKGA